MLYMKKGNTVMLSIGEFSKMCEVSTKTLRYYDEINLISPSEINPENGYRYYSIHQLETMLLIARLKSYSFSLEEIKDLLLSQSFHDDTLTLALLKKQQFMIDSIAIYEHRLVQLQQDIEHIKQGKSMLSYFEDIDVQLEEVENMNLLSIHKMVNKSDMKTTYTTCFQSLLHTIAKEKVTMVAPPMVLFHDDEFHEMGMDIEFALPIKEVRKDTTLFAPGLCLKTTLQGPYTSLSSIYTKQIAYAKAHGYSNHNALFEVYVNDPSMVNDTQDLQTIVYYPIKKGDQSHGL